MKDWNQWARFSRPAAKWRLLSQTSPVYRVLSEPSANSSFDSFVLVRVSIEENSGIPVEATSHKVVLQMLPKYTQRIALSLYSQRCISTI